MVLRAPIGALFFYPWSDHGGPWFTGTLTMDSQRILDFPSHNHRVFLWASYGATQDPYRLHYRHSPHSLSGQARIYINPHTPTLDRLSGPTHGLFTYTKENTGDPTPERGHSSVNSMNFRVKPGPRISLAFKYRYQPYPPVVSQI